MFMPNSYKLYAVYSSARFCERFMKGPLEGSAKGLTEGRLRRRRPCEASCLAS